jgi:glutamate synthase domain-containing protein 2
MDELITDPQIVSGESGASAQVTLDGTNWSNFIPPDLKDDQSFGPFAGKDVGEVLRSFVNAQRMIGADKVIVPAGKNDTPEVWNEVFNRLGRPKDVTGYQFEEPALPEGLPRDQELEEAFKKWSHEAGLNNKQAANLFKFYNEHQAQKYTEYTATAQAKQREAFDQAVSTMKAEYGTKFDEKVLLAKKVIRTYGGTPEEVEAFIGQYGNDPRVIRTLVKLGEQISESKLISGERPGWEMTGEEARKKATDIMSNENNPLHKAYLSKDHPQHSEAVAEVERLFSSGG